MPRRLVARLFDGSEHDVKLLSGDLEGVLNNLTKTDRRWVEVIGGSVRYDSIVALLLVEDTVEAEDTVEENDLIEVMQRATERRAS